MKHLIAWTLAATVLLAPGQAAEQPTGTELLIDALVQVEEIEDLAIDRLPPRFILSWEEHWEDYNDSSAIPAAEHEALLQAHQPLIQALIEAIEAEPGPFEVAMLPESHRNGRFSGARRHAVRLLLADAERMMLLGSADAAAERVVTAFGIIGSHLRDAQSGGFVDKPWEPFVGYLLAENCLEQVHETLCILAPYLADDDRRRIAAALQKLEDARTISEANLPRWCTISLFDWMTTYEGPFRWNWTQSAGNLVDTLCVSVAYDDTDELGLVPEQLLDVVRLHPITRRHFWPGVRQMYESAELDENPSASFRRYTHAMVRGEAGECGYAVQQDVGLYRRIAENWFTLSDHIASMQSMLSGHPKVPLDPIEREPTAFATFRAALNAYIQSAAGGSIEATKRAALFAVILRDVTKHRDAEPGDEAERLAMLRGLNNLRPDDPLRFEANSRRVTERMYLEMHHQIETEWTTRERFRDLAPEWFAARGVPKAETGVQQVIKSINAEEDFQNRLHELARGWLASEMSNHRGYDINQLRYPADGELERWEDDTISEYDLQLYGPMAVYLTRDWFDDLVTVQKGTRALWELRDLLEEN